ncbi:MAG: hypothetical protein ACYTBS_22370 [Planctomycetota bacterium]
MDGQKLPNGVLMEDKNHRFRFTALFVLTATVLAAVPLRSHAGEQKEEPIRIPLKLCDKSDSSRQGWKVVRFEKIPPNKTTSDKSGLHVRIQCSADLLAYCFERETQVRSILVRGAVTGLPKIPEGASQGDRKADDFAIRFGLVVSGTRKLGRMEKFFASELVKCLSELVPKSRGIDHALFLSLANDPGPKWRRRIHPLGNGRIRERVASVKKGPGDFELKVELEKACPVFALCIVCDGDHTKSKYKVTVREIMLNPTK